MKKTKNLGKTLKPKAGFLRQADDQKDQPENSSRFYQKTQPPSGKADGRSKKTGRAEIDQEQSKSASTTGKTLDGRKPEETYQRNPVNRAENAGKKHKEKERFSWGDIKPFLKSLEHHSRAEKVVALAWKLYRSSPMTDETFEPLRFALFMRTAQAEVEHENDPPITMSREEILFIGSDCATRPDEH